ncbi:MAG: ABC transporter ATP-binding protein [Crocinitomicaceae bacterium]|jgi:ABC-type multidrug transport system ATPase subunit|nr:ABC transporter ATP-binding protein [Crocinitomicaceae bacterium]MDP4723593.1 ABC transporter ATP-binding protein [Crocinitomicaceae bacterium]MDP4738863.1 ABC transporter ATP-binding protein [Crocinitomicaceae bacterium]MDP4799029.1 ABC transporter ATP-binding protein [Crocinitomicaceae bacterium]MDP4805800.1 ABC transporter ATP-binding protein [Crocinitomicaceae bacterium]
MNQEPIIEVKGLQKNFGAFTAVKDVSFTVNKGDVFGFLGPNGAGKSTTMRCMLSLIKPNAGQINIFGKNLFEARNEILAQVGSIVEKPDFYKYLSARKNLEIFARISGADVSQKTIFETLDFVGLTGREKDKVGGFSHGMRQRLGIAQTLLHKPELIILDEPTTGLDPQGIIEVRDLILRLKNEQNKTVILSSHQLAEIEHVANRMVIINKGQTIIEGSVSELMNAQETLLSIELIDRSDAALQLLKQQFPSLSAEVISPKTLELNVERMLIPAVNAALVNAGFAVVALEPKRTLEDFFIQMTQN